MMNGVIVIDKPAGKTSHDVVLDVRRALGIKKPAIQERWIPWLRACCLFA